MFSNGIQGAENATENDTKSRKTYSDESISFSLRDYIRGFFFLLVSSSPAALYCGYVKGCTKCAAETVSVENPGVPIQVLIRFPWLHQSSVEQQLWHDSKEH